MEGTSPPSSSGAMFCEYIAYGCSGAEGARKALSVGLTVESLDMLDALVT